MSENILEKIISKKIKRVDEIKKTTKIEDLTKIIEQNKSYIDFKGKIKSNIQENKTSLIAEIKKASPSAGVIIDDYNPVDIAKIYFEKKATCLSVLTEEEFFLGNLIHILSLIHI